MGRCLKQFLIQAHTTLYSSLQISLDVRHDLVALIGDCNMSNNINKHPNPDRGSATTYHTNSDSSTRLTPVPNRTTSLSPITECFRFVMMPYSQKSAGRNRKSKYSPEGTSSGHNYNSRGEIQGGQGSCFLLFLQTQSEQNGAHATFRLKLVVEQHYLETGGTQRGLWYEPFTFDEQTQRAPKNVLAQPSHKTSLAVSWSSVFRTFRCSHTISELGHSKRWSDYLSPTRVLDVRAAQECC